MRISELTLRNFKLYGSEELVVRFDPKSHACILLGNNGCGKSTLLNAVTLSLSSYLGQFPGSSESPLPDDALHINDDGRHGDYMKIACRISVGEDREISVIRYRKGSTPPPSPSEVKEIKAYANELKDSAGLDANSTRLPIIAYYGTERGRIQAPKRKRNFKKVFARWDGYINSLTPQTDFKSFFAWFDLKEDEERRIRDERWERNFTLPELNAVRQTLERFVGEDFSSPGIKLHPLRFVMQQRGSRRELRIEQLSDGYRIIIAMVADIASRMAELNPSDNTDEILSTPGIIMIDEVDLHLHPSWQRKIVSQLVRTFPNVQFIITSHSPLVALDAPDKVEVIHIDGQRADRSTDDLENLDVNDVLMSNLFNLVSPNTSKWDCDIERRDQLLAAPELTSDERRELDRLERKLAAVRVGMPKEMSELALLVRKISDRLGISESENDKDQ